MDQRASAHKLPLWINRLLALGAILALVSVVVAALQGREHWSLHQERVIADITVNLGGKLVREHCTTCHPGGSRAISHEKDHGLPKHSDIDPHSMEKLGCTGCHLGEGMALDDRVSHGLPGLGARKVLKGEELQASCYKCHELEPLKGAEKAWQGYEIFGALPCGLCHRINPSGEGGYYGPDLSAIGSYLGLDKLYEAIREPKKEPENSIMPRFPLSSLQVRHISYFLKSRVEDPFYTTPMLMRAGRTALDEMAKTDPEHDLLSAGKLMREKKCLGCHKYKEEDGQIGPDHTYIGAMRTRLYLRRFVENPISLVPGAIMPAVPMDSQEIDRLAGFLETEAQGTMDDQDARMLYMTLCQRCHAAAGDGFGIIQPNLANFPRAFAGNKEYFRRLEDERIVESMDKGIPGTSMPPYGKLLSLPEREGLIDLVFRVFVGIWRSEKAELAPLPEKPFVTLSKEKADSLFLRKCSRCHGKAGTGHGPEELKHLPRPRNLTNLCYFAGISDEFIKRAIVDGVPGTAMPSFRNELKAAEIHALADKVERFWAAPHQAQDSAGTACDGLSRENRK
jgi:mono/diheme cytochrome c family protein